jgi:hypothetical protein
MEKCGYAESIEILDIDEFEQSTFPTFLTHIPTLVVDNKFVVGYKSIVDYMITLENKSKTGTDGTDAGQQEYAGVSDNSLANYNDNDDNDNYSNSNDNYSTRGIGNYPSNDTDNASIQQERSMDKDVYNNVLEQAIAEREQSSNIMQSRPRQEYINPQVSDQEESRNFDYRSDPRGNPYL